MGADALLCMLNLPVKINAIIRARVPLASELRVIGLPELSFLQDDEMTEFVEYMQSHLEANASMRAEFEHRVDIYNTAKEVTPTHTKKNSCLHATQSVKKSHTNLLQTQEARNGIIADLRNPGGWPLGVSQGGDDAVAREFRRFGLPQLPIMMQWQMRKNPVHYVSFDAFRLNTGKLPQLVMVHLRKFLTFDPMNLDSDSTDNIMLRHPELATPFAVTMRYYGEQANPLENLATAGCLQEWWSSMRDHITRLRSANTITPTAAISLPTGN